MTGANYSVRNIMGTLATSAFACAVYGAVFYYFLTHLCVSYLLRGH